MLDPLFFGLATGLGLIVAIGAQNAYVIRQGVLGRQVFAVAAVCTICDVALIAVGVAGVGTAIAQSPWLTAAAAWGGAAFLIWFGLRALFNAVRRDHQGLPVDGLGGVSGTEADDHRPTGTASPKAQGAVATALALSLLNPHVYLDTVVILGSIGGQLDLAGRIWFFVGASLASVAWFFGIAYGARQLRPLFRRPIMSRALDGFVAAVMFAVAAVLIWQQIG